MLVFQMRNVDKTSTVLKQTKNSDYMNKNIKYSQNFLTSEKVLNQIIKQLNLKETDTVYEIVKGI